MKQARSSATIAILLVTAAALAACSSKPRDPTENLSPNQIYAQASGESRSGSWDKAIPLYERLEGRAAGTQLAQQAELDKAYALYKNEQRPEAIAALDRFVRLHPTSPAVPYALYLKGVVNFNDRPGLFAALTRQDLSERDQRAAKDAFEAFRELTERYPDSRYSSDARTRMRYIINALAQYEVHVARYYYRRGAYVASIDRAQEAVQNYRDAPALEEALYILMRSYDELGMEALRDDTRDVLVHNYPHSPYLEHGFSGAPGKAWWKFW